MYFLRVMFISILFFTFNFTLAPKPDRLSNTRSVLTSDHGHQTVSLRNLPFLKKFRGRRREITQVKTCFSTSIFETLENVPLSESNLLFSFQLIFKIQSFHLALDRPPIA